MTIYDKEGLRVDIVDEDAVAIYVEGVFRCEFTLSEWFAINKSIPTSETVKFDVFG